MYTSFQPIQNNVMPILNSNRITDEQKREAILAMGMAACQARCISCEHCSNMRVGNRR